MLLSEGEKKYFSKGGLGGPLQVITFAPRSPSQEGALYEAPRHEKKASVRKVSPQALLSKQHLEQILVS